MSFQVKAEILLNNSNWEKNLKKSSRQIEGFGKQMKTVANGVKAAWATVGLLAFGAVADALVDMTKAAADDQKSMALLNKQMDNSWKASDKSKRAMDEYIDSMSNMTGIADDNLRPAMSKIVSVTKNITKAQKSFAQVLDISAGTGKDVNVVAAAYSKYLAGNENALNKLVPGLKEADDQLGFIQQKYGGMAAVSGKNDPFARMTVVMDNFKEKIGKSFMPVIEQFADWLASPDAQKALDGLVSKVEEFGKWFASKDGQETFKQWFEDLKSLIKMASDFLGLVADVASIFDDKKKSKTLTSVLNTREGSAAFNWMGNVPTGKYAYSNAENLTRSGGNMAPIGGTKTVNVTINTTGNGKDIVKEVRKYAQSGGRGPSKVW